MSEWIAVVVIVGLVIALTVRALYREASGKSKGCGCGCPTQGCASGCAKDDAPQKRSPHP